MFIRSIDLTHAILDRISPLIVLPKGTAAGTGG